MKKRLFVTMATMVLFSFLAIQALAAESVKIAVAAADKTPAAPVSAQPAAASYFLFFNEDGKLLEAIENPYKDADGPGPAVINFLAGKGATTVVAGFFGPRIVQIAKGKGMTVVTFKGAAQDAVKTVLQKKRG